MTKRVVAARRCAVCLILALTAACQRRPLPPLGAAAAERAPPHPASVAGPPAFIGRWAMDRAECGSRAWVLTTAALRSPSVLSCSFDRINPTDAGYTINSICTVGKARAPGRLVFTMTGQGAARALTISGGPFNEPMALARCPGEASAALQAASSDAPRGG